MQLGYGALGPLGDLLGLNGNDKAKAAIDNLKQSSLYQSLFGNGLEANLQNASATGGIRGGNEVTSLDDFGRDTLAQVIQQKIANLFGATNVGQGATGSVTQVGENTSDNISNGMIGIGNSKAGVVAGQQNVWNGFANSIQKLLSSIPTGGF